MVGVGRDLYGSSSPTPLPKQGHLQQAAQGEEREENQSQKTRWQPPRRPVDDKTTHPKILGSSILQKARIDCRVNGFSQPSIKDI